MALLFDQNLSPRLVGDLFTGSTHVRHVKFQAADDVEIWNYALNNALIIVAKDDDLRQRRSSVSKERP